LEGFVVDLRQDGPQPNGAVHSGSYAIVLDLGLPGTSGGTASQLAQRQVNVTPVLVLTAPASCLDRGAVLNLGADDFLSSRSTAGAERPPRA